MGFLIGKSKDSKIIIGKPPSGGLIELGDQNFVKAIGYIANRKQVFDKRHIRNNSLDEEVLLSLLRNNSTEYVANTIAGTSSWVFWNSQKHELIICCDRIGQNPIYIYQTTEFYWISDSVEQLLEIQDVKREWNEEAIIARLAYLPVPSGQTFYRDISVVPPASYGIIKRREFGVKCYWRPELQPLLRLKNDQEYSENLLEVLTHIIEEHTPTGKLAVTVSSGLDTNSIAASLRLNNPKRNIIGIGFERPKVPEADESVFIHEVCEKLNLKNVKIRGDSYSPFSRNTNHESDISFPFSILSNNVWKIAFEVLQNQGVDCVFAGLGGDELTGGQSYAYADLFLSLKWKELFRQLRIHYPLSGSPKPFYDIPKQQILLPILLAYFSFNRKKRDKLEYLYPSYQKLLHTISEVNNTRTSVFNLPGRILRAKIHPLYIEMEALQQMSTMAKKYQLDLRVPLRDHRLVEFALSLPSNQTFNSGMRKSIFRNAMRGILPESVIKQRIKITPTEVAKQSAREKEKIIRELLSNMYLQRNCVVNEKKLQESYDVFLETGNIQKLINVYLAVATDIWLKRWF